MDFTDSGTEVVTSDYTGVVPLQESFGLESSKEQGAKGKEQGYTGVVPLQESFGRE